MRVELMSTSSREEREGGGYVLLQRRGTGKCDGVGLNAEWNE